MATAAAVGAACLVAAVPAHSADPAYPSGTFTSGPRSQVMELVGGDHASALAYVDVVSLVDDSTPLDQLLVTFDPGRNARGIEPDLVQAHGPVDGPPEGWGIRYQDVGVYVPEVTLVDGDGNTTVIAVDPITVVWDSTDPRVAVTLPRPRLRNSVHGWRTLHGTASDAQMRMFDVTATVMQRRAFIWYVYDADRRRWIKGFRSEQRTWNKIALRHSISTQRFVRGTWNLGRLNGLRRGLLVVWVTGIDFGGNSARAPAVRYQLRR